MKNKFAMMISLVIAGVLMSGCAADTEGKKETEKTAVETEAETAETESAEETEAETADPDALFGSFETVAQTGEKVTHTIFSEAEVTMVNIWGTFCRPCVGEMPALGELAEEYAEKGVQIVGIMTDVYEAGDETAQLLIDYTGADYTHLVLSESLKKGYLSEVQAVPTTVFVDREGRQIGKVYTGAKEKAVWAGIIEEVLAEK